MQHLQDYGTFELQTHVRGHGRSERILHAEEQILERDEKELHIIPRRLAAEVGVSQFVVHRTLKKQGHIHTMFKKCKVSSPNFLQCILFTGEAGFTRNAVFYSHNTQIWSDENNSFNISYKKVVAF